MAQDNRTPLGVRIAEDGKRELELDRLVIGRGTPAEIVIESTPEGAVFTMLDCNGVGRIQIARTGGYPTTYGVILFNGDGTGLIDIGVNEEGAFLHAQKWIKGRGYERVDEIEVDCQQAAPREYDPAADVAAARATLAALEEASPRPAAPTTH